MIVSASVMVMTYLEKSSWCQSLGPMLHASIPQYGSL
jgi:hypothetical protein